MWRIELCVSSVRRLVRRYGLRSYLFFFFFNDTATTEIYTLSLHDALPIYRKKQILTPMRPSRGILLCHCSEGVEMHNWHETDRKSTRLNSSHLVISYAVFCLKKKIQLGDCLEALHPTPGPRILSRLVDRSA